ncbi:M48 family metallopeptidase [Agarivorans sp. QJM3NY_29]|uniref:M48 family metallopeptidase n=1 Tax=unclassified Agarivorans TaxID=2636026 RepID=UPI003D7C4177
MLISGKVFVANSSLIRAACLSCSDEGKLELRDEEGCIRASLAEVEVSMAIGRQPRSLIFANGHRFVAEQPEQLAAWLELHGKGSLAKRIESNLLAIVFGVLLSALLMFWSIDKGLPRLAHYLAGFVPYSVSQELGQQTLSQLQAFGFQDSQLDASLQQQISANFARLVEGTGELPGEPKLFFYNMGEQANAFALADGSIIVTDRLVSLMQQPEQLNGILLHELGHFVHHDGMTALVRSTLVTSAVMLLVGDASALVDGLMGAAVLGLNMGYSREVESRADLFACHSAAHLGLSGGQILAGYQQLFNQQQTAIPQWISSHPEDQQRILQLKSCLQME